MTSILRKTTASNTGIFTRQDDDVSLAVNAYLVASKRADEGYANADKEKRQHLRTIQNRYWRNFFSILSSNISKNRTRFDLSDDERLFADMGVVDIRMLRGDSNENYQVLQKELHTPGDPGTHYLSEWLAHRYQQLQLEDVVTDVADSASGQSSQLAETRQRVLTRLSEYFIGLPGIPKEVSDSMSSGELDNAILSLGINLLGNNNRSLLLKRRNLWNLREQILNKARARVDSQGALKLFEALNELYGRDWRERHAEQLRCATNTDRFDLHNGPVDETVSASLTVTGLIMLEARQMRMRMSLAAAVNGDTMTDIVLHSDAPRLTKADIAYFLPLVQSFDRSLIELPPLIIVPGLGRGMFAWETGCILLSIRPAVGTDDSVATALAFQRMFNDRNNRNNELKAAYESAFPGSNFYTEFPVDYRAWLCRLSKGEISAMSPERRNFFREWIGPDLSGPLLPVNLRNIGPQTLDIICRRLEKQISSGESDFKLNRRLGALYWYQGNLEAAMLQFNAAMQLAPKDGELLFTVGMFMRAQNDPTAAQTFFKYGAERAQNSLWGVYCQDALAGLF